MNAVSRRRRIKWLFAAVFLLPIALSAWLFLIARPGGKPAYGELVQPQRPVPQLTLKDRKGQPVDLRRYDGYWLIVVAAPAACDSGCQHLLYDLRQFQLAAGQDAERVARVWLITDDAPINPGVMAPAAGTMMLRADAQQLRAWLPLGQGEDLQGPIWLVDPLGHLMLRFPANPDPIKALSVLKKLLYNSEGLQPRQLEPLR